MTLSMYDIFSQPDDNGVLLSYYHIQNMYLYPHSWSKFKTSVQLNWDKVTFSNKNLALVPRDSRGVYSFVVQPGIANHPACSYLLYIVKTERNFHDRFREYLGDESAGIESRRPHISGMLKRWRGYLWFYYAHIEDIKLIKKTENALICAYLPPANKEIPGILKKKIKFFAGI